MGNEEDKSRGKNMNKKEVEKVKAEGYRIGYNDGYSDGEILGMNKGV